MLKKILLPMMLMVTLFLTCSSAFAVRRFSVHDSANLAGYVEVYGKLQTTYNYYLEVTDTSIDGESGATFIDDRDKAYEFKIKDDKFYEGTIEGRQETYNYKFTTSDNSIQGEIHGGNVTYVYNLSINGDKVVGKITPSKGPVRNFNIAFGKDGIISGYIGDLLTQHRVKLSYRDEQLTGKIIGKRVASGDEVKIKFNLTIPEMTRPMFCMIVFNIIYQDLLIDIKNEKISF